MANAVSLARHKLVVSSHNLQDIYDLGLKELKLAANNKQWDKVHELALKLAHMDNALQLCKHVLLKQPVRVH